ncbi:MAG: hypothetical protein H0X22_06320 [Acidimicrobiia bacterium]|jgi:hypothetical protein|nr:hypothetical protein [Acidimicrobiia bacterium]MBA3802504.1 hypothetical protein [Acidimicrobiia bacterium]
MLLPMQVQVLAWWATARERVVDAGERLRDERGETTAGVILLVLLAVAAIGVAAAIIGKLNSQTSKIPG